MKTSFPDIPLSPVNRQAAELLAASDPEQINDSLFRLELQKECDELAASIASMEGQLASFQGEPNEWHRQCSYNLNVATKKLKTNRHIITMISQMASEIAKHQVVIAKAEAKTAQAQGQIAKMQFAAMKQEEITKRLAEIQQGSIAKAVAKAETHAVTMQQDLVHLKAFRKACRETVGLDMQKIIHEKAEELIASGWKPN
jgi:hypothetical protein